MAAKPHALQKNWGCAATASLHTPNFLNEQRAFQKFGMTHGLLTELILCGGQTPGSFSLLGGSGRVSSEEATSTLELYPLDEASGFCAPGCVPGAAFGL